MNGNEGTRRGADNAIIANEPGMLGLMRTIQRRSEPMRQLIGKIPIRGQKVIEEVYLSEQIRCRECQKTVPIGVEVVTVQKDGQTKKVLKRTWYCRSHAGDYESRALGEG